MYNEYLVTIVANVKVVAEKVYNFDTLKNRAYHLSSYFSKSCGEKGHHKGKLRYCCGGNFIINS